MTAPSLAERVAAVLTHRPIESLPTELVTERVGRDGGGDVDPIAVRGVLLLMEGVERWNVGTAAECWRAVVADPEYTSPRAARTAPPGGAGVARAYAAAGSDTSAQAASAATGGVGSALERVAAVVEAAGITGVTCGEVEDATGLTHQSASARLHDLVATRQVREAGKRVYPGTGREQRVLVWGPPLDAPRVAERTVPRGDLVRAIDAAIAALDRDDPVRARQLLEAVR